MLRNTKNTHIGIKTFMIFVISILLLLILVGFRPNTFQADDTITQQEPVTNMMLEKFFTTGKMPYIDFYAYKKANILSEGLYGLYNPFVLVSFLIAKYFFSMQIGTFSIYIFFMVAMGNCCLYLLFKSLGKRDITAFLIILACMGTSCYAYYSYYYFIYGCYFFIPLLCLVIYKTQTYPRLKFCGAGIVLAFSALTGHMQYVVYFYAIYAVAMLFLALKRSIHYLIQMISNILTGVILSCIHLYFTYTGTINRELIFGSDNQFLLRSVHPISFFKNFAYPLWATKDAKLYTGWWNVEYYYEVTLTFIFLGVLLPLFLLFFVKRIQEALNVSQKSKEKYTPLFFALLIIFIALKRYYLSDIDMAKILICAVIPLLFVAYWIFATKRISSFKSDYECIMAIVALCIIIVSFGADGGLAIILSKLPVINSFRYLYKVTLLFIPLMAIPAASVLDDLICWCQKKKQLLCLISLICLVLATDILGLCNNYYIYTSGINEYTNNSRYKYNNGTDYYSAVSSRLKELNLDTENYRVLACLPGDTLTDFIEFASSESYVYMTKNLNTAYKCFTLMGYCNSITTDSYKQSDAIMTDITLNGQFTNAIWGASYFQELNSLKSDDIRVQRFYEQMKKNAVKYFICSTSDADSMEQFCQLINRSDDIRVESIKPFVDSASIITLTGIDTLITNDNHDTIGMESEVDTLTFPLDTVTGQLYVSMTYDPHYVATYHAPDGTINNLCVSAASDHYTCIQTDTCIPVGYITLTYKNVICDIVMIVSVIITLLFITLIAFIIRTSRRKQLK